MSAIKKHLEDKVQLLDETLDVSAGPLGEDELRRRIAEAAYYKAEKRGFLPGNDYQDWLEAETEVLGEASPADA